LIFFCPQSNQNHSEASNFLEAMDYIDILNYLRKASVKILNIQHVFFKPSRERELGLGQLQVEPRTKQKHLPRGISYSLSFCNNKKYLPPLPVTPTLE